MLEYKHKLPFHFSFSLVVSPHFFYRPTSELFELLRDLAAYYDMMISSEVFSELFESPLYTVHRLIDDDAILFIDETF